MSDTTIKLNAFEAMTLRTLASVPVGQPHNFRLLKLAKRIPEVWPELDANKLTEEEQEKLNEEREITLSDLELDGLYATSFHATVVGDLNNHRNMELIFEMAEKLGFGEELQSEIEKAMDKLPKVGAQRPKKKPAKKEEAA